MNINVHKKRICIFILALHCTRFTTWHTQVKRFLAGIFQHLMSIAMDIKFEGEKINVFCDA